MSAIVMSQEFRRHELEERTQRLLQGPLKHVKAAALAAVLVPLASVGAGTAEAQSFCPSAGVCGFVWNDANGDGIQDLGESGITGAIVTLGSLATATDENGFYYFAVGPGTYEIAVQIPPGTQPSPANVGADDSVDSDGVSNGAASVASVTLVGAEDTNTDFGFSTPSPDAAVVLVIDEDSIDNGNLPNFFSAADVNDDIAEIGVRAQLRYFAQHVGLGLTLYTGQVGDEGWFALKTIPSSWATAGPSSDGLTNYLAAGPGLGTPNTYGDRESRLNKVPDVTPLRATGLKMLEGRSVCAVVYDSDVSINYDPLDGSLKGANLGVVAFRVLAVTRLYGGSSSSLPQVDVEILDAAQICAGALTLFLDAPAPTSSSVPFDIQP